MLTQNEPRVPQVQPTEEVVEVATEAATVIDGVMGGVARLTKNATGHPDFGRKIRFAESSTRSISTP